MRKIYCYLLVIIMMSLWGVGAQKVLAINTEFSTQALTDSERNTVVSNANILLLAEEPPRRGIDCFDVNEQGMIVVSQGGDSKKICVYSEDGCFQYGYSFRYTGDLALEWDGDVINVYLVRSDIIMALDKNGEVLDVAVVEDTDANSHYLDQLLHSTKRIIGDNTYALKNGVGALKFLETSYSQIVRLTSTEDEIVIYDATSFQLAKTVATCVAFGVFVAITIAIIALKNSAHKRYP